MRVGGLADARADRCQPPELVWLPSRRSTPDTIHVVLQHEGVRSIEIQDELEMGPNTLAQPLKTFGQTGLIPCSAYLHVCWRAQQILWWVEHSATSKACDLDPMFDPLTKGSQHHTPESGFARGAGPLMPNRVGHVIP